MKGKHDLSSLFRSGQQVLTQLRLTQEQGET